MNCAHAWGQGERNTVAAGGVVDHHTRGGVAVVPGYVAPLMGGSLSGAAALAVASIVGAPGDAMAEMSVRPAAAATGAP